MVLPFVSPVGLRRGVLVNRQGLRFVNEDVYHPRLAHHAIQQLGKGIYLVVNHDDYHHPPYLNAEIAGTGETIEEMAEEIGLPPGNLAHTIAYYNEHAANGEDPLFHKSPEWLKPIEPPYAALDCTPGSGVLYPFFTLGGLDTLPTGEVLTMDGRVIAGLYAAGRASCGVPRTAAGYASGLSVGDATFFGRMAGKRMAAAPSRG